jgi:hypothetical protein
MTTFHFYQNFGSFQVPVKSYSLVLQINLFDYFYELNLFLIQLLKKY